MLRHTLQHIKSLSPLSQLTLALDSQHCLAVTKCIMSNTVKNFSVGSNPINKDNIFTSGDYLTGQITFELAKDCNIDSLCVKLKGKAKVSWTEHYGKTVIEYHNKEKFFSIKQFIIQEGQGK